MKHTQGPWTTRTAFKHGEPVESVIQAGTEVLASAYDLGSDRRDEMEANARLIAAAPDLLEACKTFAEWLRREDAGFDHRTNDRKTTEGEAAWKEWYYGNLDLCGKAQDQAVAAIKKAEGNDA
jgi:hypothetical protein